MLGVVGKLLSTPIIGAVDGLVKTIFGSRRERDQFATSENVAGMNQFATEFQYSGPRYWFDVFVDGVNRLMRPSMWFSVLALFYLAAFNPAYFTVVISAIALVPEALWVILGIMVGFLFPSRMIKKLPVVKAFSGIKPIDPEAVRQAQFEQVMEDDSETLPNWAILEWNRRRGNA